MFDRDTVHTANGPLTIIPIHHATLALQWGDHMVYCDPVGGAQRYQSLDRPSLILLTHHHGDHFDMATLDALVGENTRLVAPRIVYDQMPADIAARTRLMANGDSAEIDGIAITAVPMYNTSPERAKYHEKGVGNGYVLDFVGTRVYLASDTEPTPEMDGLGLIDVAFFPMNLPYTMTPEQVLDCIEKTRPKLAYPFHYRYPFDQIGTEPQALIDILPVDSPTEVRARNWYPDL